MKLNELPYTVVRIDNLENNNPIGGGTGIFFIFEQGESRIPVILTNRHVPNQGMNVSVAFGLKDSNGNRKIEPTCAMIYDNPKWVFHPDSNVDLAVLPMQKLIDITCVQEGIPHFVGLTESDILSENIEQTLNIIEDVIVVSTPGFGKNASWDFVNNIPIVKKTTTCSYLKYPYQGKDEFIIDYLATPGSSGSPVFLQKEKNYYFVGVLRGSGNYYINGEINMGSMGGIRTDFTMHDNTGFVISSKRVTDFKTLLFNK